MNKVSIFEHPEFGRIRTLEIDGKIWFCASDVAAALGDSNPRDAVVRHCKPMGVVVYDTPTRSAVQKIKYIRYSYHFNPSSAAVSSRTSAC